MKVSVLITTYNLEKYIAETLDSVFAQETDFDYEIIIGDDGSSDGTLDIVRKYQEEHPGIISYYVMPREAGIKYNRIKRSAANRLNIAKYAKGQYCTFLDGDDYYTDNKKLQKQVEILDKPENADCAICAHNVYMAYEDGTGFLLSRAKVERKFSFNQYWKLTYICTHGLLFRNHFKDNMPSGNLAAYFDDNMIAYWAFQFGNMYYIPDSMAAYRQLSSSNWNDKSKLEQLSANIIDYGIEIEVDKRNRHISNIRHYPEYSYLYKHRKEINRESISASYDCAEEDNITDALEIYNMYKASLSKKLSFFARLITSALGYYWAKAGRFVEKRLGKY